MTDRYGVVVIRGGSTGENVAGTVAGHGVSVALVVRELVGGGVAQGRTVVGDPLAVGAGPRLGVNRLVPAERGGVRAPAPRGLEEAGELDRREAIESVPADAASPLAREAGVLVRTGETYGFRRALLADLLSVRLSLHRLLGKTPTLPRVRALLEDAEELRPLVGVRSRTRLVGEHAFRAFAVRGTAPADDDHYCRVSHAAWRERPGGLRFHGRANRVFPHTVPLPGGSLGGTPRGPRASARLGRVGSLSGMHDRSPMLFTSWMNRGSICVSHSCCWLRMSATRTEPSVATA